MSVYLWRRALGGLNTCEKIIPFNRSSSSISYEEGFSSFTFNRSCLTLPILCSVCLGATSTFTSSTACFNSLTVVFLFVSGRRATGPGDFLSFSLSLNRLKMFTTIPITIATIIDSIAKTSLQAKTDELFLVVFSILFSTSHFADGTTHICVRINVFIIHIIHDTNVATTQRLSHR